MSGISKISPAQWQEAKDRLDVPLPLGKSLQNSLQVGRPASKAMMLASPAVGPSGDELPFSFDIKILSVSGTLYKSGKLEAKVSVIGIQVGETVVDLSQGEFCQNPSVGVEEVKYCFYLKDSCLYTRGYVEGWFHERQSW